MKIKNTNFYKFLRNLYLKINSKNLYIISSLINKLNKSKLISRKSILETSIYEKGYIYTAFGENFYKECINSAKILKLNTDLPIHLFTDQKSITNKEREIFHSIQNVPNLHIRSKVDYISLSPFNKTIYLDTDVIIVKNIDELFLLLDNYDILATLDTARKRENISKLIKEYKNIPYSFGEINSGLLCFNKYAKDKILKKWPSFFYKYMNQSGGWDQPSLRILLWKSKASLYILPPEFNIRSKKLLAKVKKNKVLFGVEHMSPRIYHMHLYDDIYKKKITYDMNIKEMIKEAAKNAYDITY